MPDSPTNASPDTTCPYCSGAPEYGDLPGKHNRVRSNRSGEGVTTFHGTPPMRLIRHAETGQSVGLLTTSHALHVASSGPR